MNLINSDKASSLICMPPYSEPGLAETEQNSLNGALIGISEKRTVPVFLNIDNLLNPHILICGMTGGGKTYLTRSLLVRLMLFSDSNAIVIDFTGEYGIAYSMQSRDDVSAAFSNSENLSYFDLHNLKEQEKVNQAQEILDKIAIFMRKRAIASRRVFVFLDEAWKLVERSKGLEIIIREGRKYRVGLVTSSQLLNDTSQTILSNVATVLVFRTSNTNSLEKLSRSYNLSEKDLSSIKGLDRGSCILIMQHISGFRSAFTIKKVVGITNVETVSIIKGENMEIKVNSAEFERFLKTLCDQERIVLLKNTIKDGRVELPALISAAIETGAERRSILMGLHKFGFSYADIADSFAMALHRLGELDGG